MELRKEYMGMESVKSVSIAARQTHILIPSEDYDFLTNTEAYKQ
jgi:hypothetical protein